MSNNKKVELKDLHVWQIEKEHNGRFFSQENMKFAKSRICQSVSRSLWLNKEPVTLFITSEVDYSGENRYFTIRAFNQLTKTVKTYGEYQAYGSRYAAVKAMQEVKEDKITRVYVIKSTYQGDKINTFGWKPELIYVLENGQALLWQPGYKKTLHGSFNQAKQAAVALNFKQIGNGFSSVTISKNDVITRHVPF